MEINIQPYDKVEVLQALYDHAKPQGLGFLAFEPEPLEYAEAKQLLAEDTYFDYLKGRVLKIDLSGPTFDARLYDRDNGYEAAKQAISTLREVA